MKRALALLLLLGTVLLAGCGTIRPMKPCERAYMTALEVYNIRNSYTAMPTRWDRPSRSDYCRYQYD